MKTDANCIFCKIVAGQMPCFKLLEDAGTLAIMDIYPANDGHCLVLSKEHFPTVFDISDQAFAAVSYSVNRVARAVNQAAREGDGFELSVRGHGECRQRAHLVLSEN